MSNISTTSTRCPEGDNLSDDLVDCDFDELVNAHCNQVHAGTTPKLNLAQRQGYDDGIDGMDQSIDELVKWMAHTDSGRHGTKNELGAAKAWHKFPGPAQPDNEKGPGSRSFARAANHGGSVSTRHLLVPRPMSAQPLLHPGSMCLLWLAKPWAEAEGLQALGRS